jgi:meckelin
VSVFILQDALHGYYIHGRSVHGYADTDMWEMREHLRKEEENLTGQRGLVPDSDQQTFEMYVPPLLRQQWNNVLLNVLDNRGATGAGGAAGLSGGGGGGGAGGVGGKKKKSKKNKAAVTEQSLYAYVSVNRFLCAFIDHSFRDLDYVVQDKLFLQSALQLTPRTHSRGVLYNDDGQSFAQVVFYGNESTLFMLDMLVFCAIDYLSGSYIAAAAVTYAVSFIATSVRESLSSSNIARKTLVDERFLV